MLKITNQTKETAELYISGDIVDDVDGVFLKYFRDGDITGFEFPKKFQNELKEVEDKELTIFINSYGGNVFAGVALSKMIERRKNKTVCIVDGICASIATQIFFAADICKIPANCYLMIHKPEVGICGNADEMRKTADTLDTIQAGLETIYNKKAKDGVNAEKISELVNAETWLTGQDCEKYFNVEVLEPVQVVNCFGNAEKLRRQGIKNFPSVLNFINEQKTAEKSDFVQKIKISVARAKGALI